MRAAGLFSRAREQPHPALCRAVAPRALRGRRAVLPRAFLKDVFQLVNNIRMLPAQFSQLIGLITDVKRDVTVTRTTVGLVVEGGVRDKNLSPHFVHTAAHSAFCKGPAELETALDVASHIQRHVPAAPGTADDLVDAVIGKGHGPYFSALHAYLTALQPLVGSRLVLTDSLRQGMASVAGIYNSAISDPSAVKFDDLRTALVSLKTALKDADQWKLLPEAEDLEVDAFGKRKSPWFLRVTHLLTVYAAALGKVPGAPPSTQLHNIVKGKKGMFPLLSWSKVFPRSTPRSVIEIDIRGSVTLEGHTCHIELGEIKSGTAGKGELQLKNSMSYLRWAVDTMFSKHVRGLSIQAYGHLYAYRCEERSKNVKDVGTIFTHRIDML